MKYVKCFFLSFVVVFANTVVFAQERSIEEYIQSAPFKMPSVNIPVFAKKVFSIVSYGAIGDGQALNTKAFANTIDACAAAGGGEVVVPPGIWLTGPIELKSNINFHIERGALVLFTPDKTQYPLIESGKNSFLVMSPIYGANLENVGITGEGIFDGSGEAWRPLKKMKATEAQWKKFVSSGGVVSKDGSVWWPSKEAMEGEAYLKKLKKEKAIVTADDFLPARDFLRPKMVVLSNCKNVLLDGPTFKNSPNFVINPQKCTNLTIRNVQVNNEWWAQNGDGIDISACKNVVIYKTTVKAGDDGICMKSSGGKELGKAELENILIADCIVYQAHGGFVIGSNTDGGMNNIWVTNCNFIGTDVGIRVKSNSGRGGLVHNIFINKIYMHDIVNEAILFDTYYEDVQAGKSAAEVKTTVKNKIPEFTDFHIRNVYCNGAKQAIAITGLPEMPVHHIYFDNLVISADKGFESKDAADIDLKKVSIITKQQPVFITNGCKNINVHD
ncbi:MAG: glycoside hydrolase family 28 protein [Bacteroidota bacterium]|nr:glycoside hydrolase family 28 protein [Bacteroidota bacterium]